MHASQLFSGSVKYPYPGITSHWSASARREASVVLNDLQILGIEIGQVNPQADVEDFWESAARASAAVRASKGRGLQITPHAARYWSSKEMQNRLGPVAISEEQRHGDDPLLSDPLLLAHGGRAMLRGTFPTDPDTASPDNILQWMRERHRAGVSRAVVKLAGRKAGLFTVELSGSIAEMRDQFFDEEALGWTVVRETDRTDAFLVQDWVPMQHEYRFFIVDGLVVTGAGCVEELTPPPSMLTSTRCTKIGAQVSPSSTFAPARSDVIASPT